MTVVVPKPYESGSWADISMANPLLLLPGHNGHNSHTKCTKPGNGYIKDAMSATFLALQQTASHLRLEVKETITKGKGPYDLKNYNFQSCSDISKPKITFHIKEKKLNRNTFAYDLNVTNKIPFDDNLTAVLNVAERTSRGRFKDNSFVRETPKACTMFKTFIPGIFNILARELMKTTGENLGACHLAPSSRSLSNMIFDEKSKKIAMAAPAFWYKQYIMRVYMKRQSAIISCLQYNLDVVPKKN